MMAARSLAWLQRVGRALSVIYKVFLSSFVYFVVFFWFQTAKRRRRAGRWAGVGVVTKSLQRLSN